MLRNLRNPQNLTRKKPQLGLPRPSEGLDGDLQLHITEGGLGLYGKVNSRWFKFGNAQEISQRGNSSKSRRFLQDMSVKDLSVSRTLSIDNAHFSTDTNLTSTNRDYLQIHSKVFTLESATNKSQIDVGDIVLQHSWGSSSTTSTISLTTSEGHGKDLKITSGGTEGVDKNGGDLFLSAGDKSGSGTPGSITLGASSDGSVNAAALNINASNTIIAATLTLNEHTSGTVGIQTVQDSGTSFVDNDTSLMTAAAIADKIEGYGYSTASGDITGVTAGDGLSGGGSSGGVSLAVNVDDSTIETNSDTLRVKDSGITLAKMADIADDRILGRYDEGSSGAPIALTASTVRAFLNVADGATANTGDITAVTAGTNCSGGGSSGSVTINVDDAFLVNDADDTTTGTITAGGFTTTGTWTFDDATSGTVGITTVHTGSSFTDNDTSLMTAGAIKEKIEDYGYTTNTGDITGVDLTGGTGISIDSETNTTSGSYSSTITCNLEGTELISTGETGGNKYLREDGDGTCSWQTVSASGNFLTDNADDTMAGALIIDKDSAATTNTHTKALVVDLDQTGITDSGQTIRSTGMTISVNDESVTHVGTHYVSGLTINLGTNDSGTSYATGISNNLTHISGSAADTSLGFSQTVPDAGVDIRLHSSANLDDTFEISTGANGATTLTTVDDDDALAHLTLDPDGDLLISGADVMIDAGKKLYLDGDGHTYFTESSDDVLDLFIGGTQIYRISELGANTFFEMMAGAGFSVPFQAPLYLDGGANTYIKSNTADQISLHCGAATVFTIAEDGSTNGDYASFGTTGAGFTQFEPTYDATDTYVFFNRKGNKAHLTFLATGTAIDDIHMHFPPVSGNFQLLIKQHASGGGSVNNWKTYDKAGSNASTVVWPAATAPTLTTGGSKIDIISLYWDADNNKAYGVASLNF